VAETDSSAALQQEVEHLRAEVREIKQMLLAIAPTVAMSAGDMMITHDYLRRILAEVGSQSKGQLLAEAFESRKFARKTEDGLELMAERAKETGASDLADFLLR